ncbi:MAG TPA: hypothetical protein VGC22_12085, partial [Chitinophaga sp.]
YNFMQQRALLAGLLCLLCACRFNAGTRKDGKTGLTLTNKGLSCENYLLERNGRPLTDKDIRFGEKVTLLLENVSGFTEKDGLVYPGMQLDVKDDKGVVVSSFTDMLADVAKSGVAPEQARVLRAAYQSGPPDVVPGRNYTLSVHIWDKQGKGTIDATLPLYLRFPDTTGLHTTPQGITAVRVFMISDSGRVTNGHVPARGHVGINFQGLRGFAADSGRVFPGGSLTVYDAEGKELFSTGDAFAHQPQGFTDTQVQEGLRITVNMDPHLKGTRSTWKFHIWDKKGKGAIDAEVPVILD